MTQLHTIMRVPEPQAGWQVVLFDFDTRTSIQVCSFDSFDAASHMANRLNGGHSAEQEGLAESLASVMDLMANITAIILSATKPPTGNRREAPSTPPPAEVGADDKQKKPWDKEEKSGSKNG